jgi:sarcosine oxidase gamma subunit
MDSAMQADVGANGTVRIASLRYYNTHGAFTAALSALRMPVPEPLRCAVVGPVDRGVDLLAWRSPTETVWICDSAPRFDEIESELRGFDDGCFVDQTCGRRLVRVRGPRGRNLLAHMGSGFAEIAVGAAKIGRMADISVLVCMPSEEETLLVVDRLYLEYLLGFMPPGEAAAG